MSHPGVTRVDLQVVAAQVYAATSMWLPPTSDRPLNDWVVSIMATLLLHLLITPGPTVNQTSAANRTSQSQRDWQQDWSGDWPWDWPWDWQQD